MCDGWSSPIWSMAKPLSFFASFAPSAEPPSMFYCLAIALSLLGNAATISGFNDWKSRKLMG